MERALKRLIWRYSQALWNSEDRESGHVEE
jgi:hypothetical protein